MTSKVRVEKYKGDEVITYKKYASMKGHLHFADRAFKAKADQTKDRDRFHGAGLYSVLLDGNLIYIGKFLGTKQNWKAGNIISSRWIKHIGTFSMLERKLSFSKRALTKIQEKNQGSINTAGTVAELYSGIEQANLNIITKDMGCTSTFERFCIAEELWRDNFKERPWMSRFTFLYGTVEGDLSTSSVREVVSKAEDKIIDLMQPRGNAIHNRKSEGVFTEQAVRQHLETALNDALVEYSNPTTVGFIENNPVTPQPDEDVNFEECFLDKIETAPESAKCFIQALREHIENRNDASIWYTGTNKGQLRIRKHVDTLIGFINVVTLDWKPKLRRFHMESRLPQCELEKAGLNIDSVTTHVLENATYITLDQLTGDISNIINVIDRAIDLHERKRP